VSFIESCASGCQGHCLFEAVNSARCCRVFETHLSRVVLARLDESRHPTWRKVIPLSQPHDRSLLRRVSFNPAVWQSLLKICHSG
jgi:hypothetical protein